MYSRKPGEAHQEVGGVVVTLAVLCESHGLDMLTCSEIEYSRILGCMDKCRTKQEFKKTLGVTYD